MCTSLYLSAYAYASEQITSAVSSPRWDCAVKSGGRELQARALHLFSDALNDTLAQSDPRLAVTGIVEADGDFAAILDQRIKRLQEAKLIEHQPQVETKPLKPRRCYQGNIHR